MDVITLIKGGNYEDLNVSVGDALLKRSDVSCTFMAVFIVKKKEKEKVY